ncbi:AML1_2 [Blepharisma stoltei]|uniref:Mei2-like C-terminal RNA recognition motif domain-containing protein n=1 Tax=Blepharisma stoltei TaxID=1481888 RepID=A0AAU9JZA9_9CILI|nr:unnamed protein product [Blepharisma stoltei]
MSNHTCLTKRRRLRIFEKITTCELEPETPSRVLEIVGLDSPEALLPDLQAFGDLQSIDLGKKKHGILSVSYFDIRDACKAKFALQPKCEVKFVAPNSDPTNADYLVIPHPTYLERLYLFQSFGDIMYTQIVGTYVLLHYFDVRCARRAYSELTNPIETEPEKFFENEFHDNPLNYKQDFDSSVSSESTEPSPYMYFSSYSSEGSNKESPFDERRKQRKKMMDEDEKMYYTINVESIERGEDIRTTIMIKNIPNKYTQQMLLDTIDRHFPCSYDFFYLPIDFKNNCNVGYAFINFLNPQIIPLVCNQFNGKRWERFNSEKICALAYARIQGRQNLVQHFQSSSVMEQEDMQVKPLILPTKTQFY